MTRRFPVSLTRWLAAGLCAALLVGAPMPALALRVGQENTGLEELKAALPSPQSGLEEGQEPLRWTVARTVPYPSEELSANQKTFTLVVDGRPVSFESPDARDPPAAAHGALRASMTRSRSSGIELRHSTATAHLLLTEDVHEVHWLTFSTDGKLLASLAARPDGTVIQLWDVDTIANVAAARSIPNPRRRAALTEALAPTVQHLRDHEERASLQSRITAARTLHSMAYLLPPESLARYRRLPSPGSQQAALAAGYLFRVGRMSEAELKRALADLARWEQAARRRRGRHHRIALEIHSEIPERHADAEAIQQLLELFMRVPENLDAADRLRVATKWEHDPGETDNYLEFQTLPSHSIDTQLFLWELLERAAAAEGFALEGPIVANDGLNALWVHLNVNGRLWDPARPDDRSSVTPLLGAWVTEMAKTANELHTRFNIPVTRLRPALSPLEHWNVRRPVSSQLGRWRTEVLGMVWVSRDPAVQAVLRQARRRLLKRLDEAVWALQSFSLRADGVRESLPAVVRRDDSQQELLQGLQTLYDQHVAAGLEEEPWLEGLMAATKVWQARGWLADEAAGAVFIDRFRQAMIHAGKTPPPARRPFRQECLKVFSAFVGQLAHPERFPDLRLHAYPRENGDRSADVELTVGGTPYLVHLYGDVGGSPLLTVTIANLDTRRVLSTVRLGMDRYYKPKIRHLDIGDSEGDHHPWLHGWSVGRVWQTRTQMRQFVQGIFDTLPAGLEERPMTGADAWLDGLRAATDAWLQATPPLLQGPEAAESLIALFHGAMARREHDAPPPWLASQRRVFLEAVSALLERLVVTHTVRVMGPHSDAFTRGVTVWFRDGQGHDYTADVVTREKPPKVTLTLRERGRELGTLRLGCDTIATGRTPHLDVADRHGAAGGAWFHHQRLDHIWANRTAMRTFVQAFHRTMIEPLFSRPAAPASDDVARPAAAGLEERPMTREEMQATMARWAALVEGHQFLLRTALVLGPSAMTESMRQLLLNDQISSRVFLPLIVWADRAGSAQNLEDRGIVAVDHVDGIADILEGDVYTAVEQLQMRGTGAEFQQLQQAVEATAGLSVRHLTGSVDATLLWRELYRHLLGVERLTQNQQLEAERLAAAVERYL